MSNPGLLKMETSAEEAFTFSINVGDTFPSYSSFREKLEAFQQETKTQFVTNCTERLSQTDGLFEKFRYNVLRLGCKQGQKNHPTQASGKRPNQKSYKVNCPVKMNVRLNRPKGKDPFLKVTLLDMNHENHQVSEELFRLYPEQRRFCSDAVDELILSSEAIKMSERKEILENRYGVTVMRQDVYNKRRKLLGESKLLQDKQHQDGCREIREKIVAEGGFVEEGKDEKGGFAFFAFITKAMASLLSKFPECLIMNNTYSVGRSPAWADSQLQSIILPHMTSLTQKGKRKLDEKERKDDSTSFLPLLTIMIIDGESHGMPVFHAFLAKEDQDLMERCLLFFSQHIDLTRVSCFIADKDTIELGAISSVFPNVTVNLCSFHIYQAVERQLHQELGRGASYIKLVLELFMKQVSTESETEFEELKISILSLVPQAVVEYFQSNWWSKRNMWAACCNVEIMKFTQTTTNTLEGYSQLKKHLTEKMSLSSCLLALLSFDNDKIMNARRQQAISLNSNVYNTKDSDETEVSISRSLTRFAADIVRQELSVFKEVVYDITLFDNPNTFLVQFKDSSQITSLSSCSCSTFGRLKLPCRHIFAVRRFISVSLFDISIVPNRFLRSCIDTTNNHQEDVSEADNTFNLLSSCKKSVDERYRKAKGLCDRMRNALSLMDDTKFIEKINQLQSLLDSWMEEDGSSHAGLVDSTVFFEIWRKAKSL